VRAIIDEERCSGCRICNNMCPYSAIDFIEDLKVSRVKPGALQGLRHVRGCLPSGIITGAHFSNAQIMAEIEGILVGLDGRETKPEVQAVPV